MIGEQFDQGDDICGQLLTCEQSRRRFQYGQKMV